MKKTLLATIDFPPARGGVANYLAGVAAHLPQDRIVVLAPKVAGTEEFDKQQPYKVYRRKLIFKYLRPRWLFLFFHLLWTARQEKVEFILAGQVLPVGTAALLVKKFLGTPYFISCHGMDILVPQVSTRKKRLLIKILNQAKGAIANSQFTKNELLKLGVEENKITIVYPCPTEAMGMTPAKVEETKKKYGLENKKILLTVGRLVARKGHDKVIEALSKILERVPETVYVIVGDGPERDKLKVKSYSEKLKVGDKVILVGEVSDEELVAFYELCSVFIMVPRQIGSDVEGFGTVYLEANQYGKPVVAGRSGEWPKQL